MNIQELKKLFKKHSENEYIEFEKVENKKSKFADIHGLLLLEEKFPPNEISHGILDNFDYETATINIEIEEDNIPLTENDIIELLRCGIDYDEDLECLTMVS